MAPSGPQNCLPQSAHSDYGNQISAGQEIGEDILSSDEAPQNKEAGWQHPMGEIRVEWERIQSVVPAILISLNL